MKIRNTSLSVALFLTALLPLRALAVTPYSYGIMPAGAADSDVTQAYNNWKSRYLKNGACVSSKYVVNSPGGNNFYSEGQAYGMLMASYLEPNDILLTELWNFYNGHKGGSGLMNWQGWGNSCGNNGENAATDADFDIAAALINADRRWPANGWGAKATTTLNAVYSNGRDSSNCVKNGNNWGGCFDTGNKALNPSYMRTGYFQSFDCFESGTRWEAVRQQAYSKLNTAFTNYSLPPDWTWSNGNYGTSTNSGGYGYDACRTPWSLGLDYLWWNDSTALAWMSKVSNVFRVKGGGTPTGAASDVGDDYNYNSGNKVSWNHENAFIGSAAVAFMGGGYPAHLDAFYNEVRFTDNNSYYSDSLKVIYLMTLTGILQEPCLGGGPVPTATATPSNTPYAGTPTSTPSAAFGLIFEDFETGITGGYFYTGPGSTLTFSQSNLNAFSGTFSDEIVVTIGASSWGGTGFNSSYAGPSGFDATGASAIRLYVMSNNNVVFQVSVNEENAVGTGDNEHWISGNQSVVGGTGWQQITIPLTALVIDVNAGNQVGDGIIALANVSQIQLGIATAAGVTMYVDDIQFLLSSVPTATPTLTPFLNQYNQIFDDMEAVTSLDLVGPPQMTGTFADGANGASALVVNQSTTVFNGVNAGRIDYDTGTAGSWGAGIFLLSPYGTPELYVDAYGAVQMGVWVNGTAGLQMQFAWSEAGNTTTAVNGGDGEAWLGPLHTLAGGWEFIKADIALFVEDLYNVNCNPTGAVPTDCSSTGNGGFDLQAVSSFNIRLAGNQGAGTLYFDDAQFITTWKTATPSMTQSFTVSPTPSPTSLGSSPTPTPTQTPLATDTATPSVTPSNTSVPPSQTATPTASATPSNTPLPPTDTATFSPTVSSTPTATPTFTDVPVGSTNTFTLTVTDTFTITQTPVPPSATNTPLPDTPTNTPQPATSTLTATPSATPSTTEIAASATPSATSSNTAVPATETSTPTPILASPTPSNTAIAASATPTGTPTPHNTYLDNFEDGDVQNLWGGTNLAIADTDGSTISMTTGSGSTLSTGTSVASACINGTIHTAPFPPYPFAQLAMDLEPTGGDVDLTLWQSDNAIRFSYKANTLGATYFIRLDSPTPITNFAYYRFEFTPTDMVWNEIVVNFPGGGGNEFAQPSWNAVPVAWAAVVTQVKGVTFGVVEDPTVPVAYDICFDDIDFTSVPSTPTPSYTVVPSTATQTNTPTASPTYTNVPPGSTATVTPTASPTATPTFTATQTSLTTGATATPSPPALGPNNILAHSAAPNPLMGAEGYIVVHLEGDADEMVIKFYTKSMMVLGKYSVAMDADGKRFSQAGWYRLAVPRGFLNSVGNGFYYYVLTATRKEGGASKPRIGKIFILR